MILHWLAVAVLAQGSTVPEPLRIVREIQVAIDLDGGMAVERAWHTTLRQRPRAPQALLAVATFERSRYRYEAADSVYRRLMTTVSDAEADAGWRAMALAGMAQWRALGSDPLRADSLFEAARAIARAANLRAIEAEATVGLSQLRLRSQGLKVGLSLLAQWWALLDEPTAQDSASRLCSTGTIDEQSGDTTGFRRIVAGSLLAERIGVWRVAGTCRLAEAQAAERRGYLISASASARLALQHFTHARFEIGTALASQWFGYVEQRRYSFASARELLEQAVRSARVTRFESVEAWAQSGLAELYLQLGDAGQARRYAARAAESHRRRGDRWGLANSLGFEAAALEFAGDLQGASLRYAEAHQAFIAAGLPLNAIPSLSARAAVQIRLGQLDSAEGTIAITNGIARTTDAWRNEQAVLLAAIAMRRGRLTVADSLLRSTLAAQAWRRGERGAIAISVAAREAQVALRANRMAVADSALAGVTRALDSWRQRPSNAGFTASLAQLGNNWGGLRGVFPDLVAQLVARDRTPDALLLIEEVRARDIAERTLRAAAILTDSTAVMRALRWDGGRAPIATVTGLQRALAGDEAFVAYSLGVGDAPTVAIIVTRDAVVHREMPAAAVLSDDIARFTRIAASGIEPRAVSDRLGRALLAPVFDALPAAITRLVISPDGALHRMPFDALRLPNGQFALERATISTTPSATVLLAVRAAVRSAGTQVVAFGDPRYSRGSAPAPIAERRTIDAALFADMRLPRLPHSGAEATRVARYGQSSVVRLGAEATAQAFLSTDFSHVGVVHIAAHSLVDPESQVGTALALASTRDVDGFIGPGQIAQLDLRGPLVMLSTCRSSDGQVLGGEGMRGLTAPLLEAGARAVVAPHWSIGDRSVVPFVDRFYAALATGARVDDALRVAKQSAIRDGVGIADWGSFSIVGDGSMRVPLRAPSLAPVPWSR